MKYICRAIACVTLPRGSRLQFIFAKLCLSVAKRNRSTLSRISVCMYHGTRRTCSSTHSPGMAGSGGGMQPPGRLAALKSSVVRRLLSLAGNPAQEHTGRRPHAPTHTAPPSPSLTLRFIFCVVVFQAVIDSILGRNDRISLSRITKYCFHDLNSVPEASKRSHHLCVVTVTTILSHNR